jgi:hypothetical protein
MARILPELMKVLIQGKRALAMNGVKPPASSW